MPDAVIIDAMNLAYRSWWNCRQLTHMVGGQIFHTGLEFGFIRNTLAHVRNHQPAQVYLAWDGIPKRALTINPQYKADRDKSNQEAEAPWIPRLTKVREAMARIVPSLYHPEMEADELIALFVKQQDATGKSTVIISNDADMYQLVSGTTQVLVSGKDEETYVGVPGVIDRFGVPPEKVPLYRAIAGDRSDNLLGIPRISDKSKVRLVMEAENIDQLVESFFRATFLSVKEKEKLTAGVDLVRTNYQIMNLRGLTGDAVIPNPSNGDTGPALQMCRDLGLKSLIERKEWTLFQPA